MKKLLFDHLERRDMMSHSGVLGDLNNDGRVNAFDFQQVAVALRDYNEKADLNQDGRIDSGDLSLMASYYHADANNLPIIYAADQIVNIGPETRIGAYYDIGGGKGPLKLTYGVGTVGWYNMIEGFLTPIADAGVPFAEFHNIWGRKPNAPMRFPIYDEVANHPDYPALISTFIPAFKEFHTEYPNFETIAYIGSPYTAPETRELEFNATQWWQKVYETIVPILQAGFKSIGFDASGWDGTWQHPLDLELFDVLMHPENRIYSRDKGLIEATGGDINNPGKPITVYFEALPVNVRRQNYTERASTYGHNHMIITYEHYLEQDPDRKNEAGVHTAKHPSYIKNGEKYSEMDEINVIISNRMCNGASTQTYEQSRRTCLNKLSTILTQSDRNTDPSGNIRLLVHPRYLVHVDGNQSSWLIPHARNETFAEFLGELNLETVPTRINLDPENANPTGTTYRITRQPQYGTLTFSEEDPNIVIYSANGVRKEDYFEFTAAFSGQVLVGKIAIK